MLQSAIEWLVAECCVVLVQCDALDDARLDDVHHWHVRFHVLLQCAVAL